MALIKNSYLGNVHEPVSPVRLVKVILLRMAIYLCEVQLRSVPAADPVVCAKVPDDGVLVGLGLVPLGEQEHVLAVLVGVPGE